MTRTFLRLLKATSQAALIALALSPVSASASLVHDIWITSIDEPNGITAATNGPIVDLHGQVTIPSDVGPQQASGVITGTAFGQSMTLCTTDLAADPACLGNNIEILLNLEVDWDFLVDVHSPNLILNTVGAPIYNPTYPMHLLYTEAGGAMISEPWTWQDLGTGATTRVGLTATPVHEAVPEPTTLALLSLGLVGLGFTRRRMKA